jgi:hypothetical protein
MGRRVLPVAAGLAIAALVAITWIQLGPWVQASRQSRHLVEEAGHTLPPLTNRWITFNVAGLPDEWKGAYVFWNGFDSAMIGFHDILPRMNRVGGADDLRPEWVAGIAEGTDATYNVRIAQDPATQLYHIADVAGMTTLTEPPLDSTRLWDFRECAGDTPPGWTASNAETECISEGLAFRPTTSDGRMETAGLGIDLEGVRWVRVAAALRYPTGTEEGMLGEWFWGAEGQSGWSQERGRSFHAASGREWRVYWTYLPAWEIGPRLESLRLDPLNGEQQALIGWIALSTIPDP